MDFPFERKLLLTLAIFNFSGIDLLLDCMVYGVLAEQAQLDGKVEQIQYLSFTYLLIHLPEVRERLLRKMYQRIRVAHALQVNSKKEVNNNVLLSKFIYRKVVLN